MEGVQGNDLGAPAAGEVLEDGVDDGRDVLKGGRERVVALLAHAVECLGDGLGFLARSLQHHLLLPLPRLHPPPQPASAPRSILAKIPST